MQILYSIGGYNSVYMAKLKKLLKLLFYFQWFEQSRHPNALQLTFGYYFAHHWNIAKRQEIEIIGLVFLKSIFGV